ncbi:hypothetical protein LAZ67_X001845, partial [Cordylochernes scorpioides]
MEIPLVNVSTCELRSVIRFFTAKIETAVNIHRNLASVYGEGCMSIQMVLRWRSWFLEGRQNVHDDERSGRPVTATDNAAVVAVRNVVEADHRVTIDEIMIRLPPVIEIGRSSIGTIMSDVFNFRKVCAKWVLRLLSKNHKQQRMEAARIVTGDESWVHHSTPETKRQSMVWKKPEEIAPKKAKVTISAGKVMAIDFGDCKGVLLVDYLPTNTTVNAASHFTISGSPRQMSPLMLERNATVNKDLYIAQFHCVNESIQQKRPDRQGQIILLHDNVRPHVAQIVKAALQELEWEALQHPPYFPDLAPTDCHLLAERHQQTSRTLEE